jgi:hypothetical protein
MSARAGGRSGSGGIRMQFAAWYLGVCLVFQVPAPSPSSDPAVELKAAAEAIQRREARELEGLAAGVAGSDRAKAIAEFRALLPAPRPRDGATRIMPLPELVPARGRGLTSISSRDSKSAGREEAGAWRPGLARVRAKSAAEFLALARRAAASNPPQYAFAGLALREVLDRQPDQPEARRLLGYVPHEGGWARPFVISQLRAGLVNHPVFGWIPADDVAHYEAGQRPAPGARGKRAQWLPADEADRLRSDWKNPWRIPTEHFEIQTDVPLGEAIEFARRLEAFHDLFFALMADVVGESLPLARRFRSPSLSADASNKPHLVYYFATKDEYVDHLRGSVGADIDQSLGYYNPPRPGKGNRVPAYFFRDLGGQLPVTATLYHEVSHQLLFETAGPNAYTRNVGNYWVFEGLGTYFETVTPRSDGSLEVGGTVGERLAEAGKSFAAGRFVSLQEFVRLDQNRFNRADRIHVNYQQAMALTVFLMQYRDSAYRDAFLDYVRDAYRGRIKLGTGRSLEDRLGKPLEAIEKEFKDFLRIVPF